MSSQYILVRTFSDPNGKGLALANGELIRRLGINENWNSIRIGMMCAVTGNGSINNQAIPFAFGLCSDLAGYSLQLTPHFVGAGFGSTALQSYNANSGNPYYTLNTAMVRRVVGVNTTAAIGQTNLFIPSTEGTTRRRGLVYVDIARSYSLNVSSTNTTVQANDNTFANFLDGLQQPGTPSVNGTALNGMSQQTIAGTDSAGLLNTMGLYWGSNVFPLEIYAIGVYRFF
jgi:hypothetical protein